MTLQELCREYDISENSVKSNFPRVQKSFLSKHNLILRKTGRGDKADFTVERDTDDKRADSMMKEAKTEIALSQKQFTTLVDFNFIIFLGVCMTPMTTFYGSYEQFLEYVEVKKNNNNIELLKQGLEFLAAEEYIRYDVDKTNEDYFWAGLYYKTRSEMAIGIDMVQRCQLIAAKNKKKSWVPLLKTWLGIQYVYDKQPFTMARLSEVTGLSVYQIRESKKLLEKDNLFITSKAYIAYDKCIGSNVELNGINESNRNFVANKQPS